MEADEKARELQEVKNSSDTARKKRSSQISIKSINQEDMLG